MSVEDDARSLLRTFAACIVQAHVRGFQQRQKFLQQVPLTWLGKLRGRPL